MNLLFRIVYATHANGTHHKLALDALRHLQVKDAEKWRRLFLSEAEVYLEGSKAPDKVFKDFKNHVLHVGDNYWGGAPEKVESWYRILVNSLKARSWHEAIWAAGIMSHYLTDPIHPFHTAQSKAENDIHRAVEWSISKSYNALLSRTQGYAAPATVPGNGEFWIKDHVIAGAERANAHYETLIAHYDLKRGVVDPPDGLDEICQALVADLLHEAAHAHARLLERAILEASTSPPDVGLTAQTFLAGLKIPIKWVLRKIDDAKERQLVEAMYDEWEATGRVEVNLPEDDRQVRELYNQEVAMPRVAQQREARETRRRHSPLPQGQIPKLASATPQPTQTQDGTSMSGTEQRTQVVTAAYQGSAGEPLARLRDRIREPKQNIQARSESIVTITNRSADNKEKNARVYLKGSDELEAAPSIGPKTAARFDTIGIQTVEQFLAADPVTVADELNTRHITAKVIVEWQQQTELVCTVPGLRGGHAQLLVGAGLTRVDTIANADPADAMAAILRFAQTSEGQRILRDGRPPDLEKIHDWVRSAQAVAAAA